jgi:hypothetical protein
VGYKKSWQHEQGANHDVVILWSELCVFLSFYDTSMSHYTWYLVPCNDLSLKLHMACFHQGCGTYQSDCSMPHLCCSCRKSREYTNRGVGPCHFLKHALLAALTDCDTFCGRTGTRRPVGASTPCPDGVVGSERIRYK